MDAKKVSKKNIELITKWCRYLRRDLGALFVADVNKFVDDLPKSLVEVAERVPPYQQQNYYDIVTLLRSHKQDLGLNIAYNLIIEEFVHYVEHLDDEEVDHLTQDLRLIETDDIEVSVIIEGLAGRLSSKINESISDAFLRIKQLVPNLQVASQLPCHPKAIIQAMLEGFAVMSATAEQKIILAQLFIDYISIDKIKDIIVSSLEAAKIPAFDKRMVSHAHNVSQPSDVAETDANENEAENTPQNQPHQFQQRAQQTNRPMSPQGMQMPQGHSNQAFNSQAQPSGQMPSQFMQQGQEHGVANSNGGIGQTDSIVINPHSNSPHTEYSQTVANDFAESFQQIAQQDAHTTRTNALADKYEKEFGQVGISGQQLLQQLGHLKQLRQEMSKVPLSPIPQNPLVEEHVLTVTEVDNVLSSLQQKQSELKSVKEDDHIQSVRELRDMIREELHSDEDEVDVIDDKERDVINVVSMIFDHILDDPNLPTAMKALLARLQIPMIRLALITPDFISDREHAARKLLDKLAEAGISWDKANEKDDFYDKLESIVFRVIKDFENDAEIFTRLYDELVDYLAEQFEISQRIEKRTLETEQKKAETQLAKSEVQKQLNTRLLSKKLPFAVIKLLQNGWWQVLYHAFVRAGVDSPRWKNAIKITDALIWSVSPPEKNRQSWLVQLEKVQQKLLTNLEKGLSSVNFDALQQSQLIREIKSLQNDLLRQQHVKSLKVTKHKPAESIDILNSELPFQLKQPKNGEMPDNIALPSGDISPPETDLSEMAKKFTSTIRDLKTGAWIEFNVDTNEPERRKLVAKIRALNKLVFTNRRGIKVAEITNTKLANLLASGQARILESEDNIVDAAVGAMLDNVNRLESTHAP